MVEHQFDNILQGDLYPNMLEFRYFSFRIRSDNTKLLREYHVQLNHHTYHALLRMGGELGRIGGGGLN